MKAHIIKSYGSPKVIQLEEVPDPKPKAGWILVAVKAFGINRSELYTRQGHSGGAVTIPRIPGIECVGEVLDSGGTDLYEGQKVAAAMGNMGRLYDGGYAEKTLVPRSNVYPVETDLDWEVFGALPETYLTAWGVLKEAIDIQPNSTLLIRGGTSSVGLACISIAKDMGCTVLATTRKESKRGHLEDAGVDHVLIDYGSVEEKVKDTIPEGVNGVVELVGLENTIMDSLRSCAPKGSVGMVGFLGNSWDYDFFPWMPSTVKLTIYSSETLHTDFATPVMQKIVDKVKTGLYRPNIHQIFRFHEVPWAHDLMENNHAAGKLVIKV